MAKYDFVPSKTNLYALLRKDELGIPLKDNNDDNWRMLEAKQGQKYQGDGHYEKGSLIFILRIETVVLLQQY